MGVIGRVDGADDQVVLHRCPRVLSRNVRDVAYEWLLHPPARERISLVLAWDAVCVLEPASSTQISCRRAVHGVATPDAAHAEQTAHLTVPARRMRGVIYGLAKWPPRSRGTEHPPGARGKEQRRHRSRIRCQVGTDILDDPRFHSGRIVRVRSWQRRACGRHPTQ